jgi:WD40 repeat protein
MRMRRSRMFSLPLAALAFALTSLPVPAGAQIINVAKTPLDRQNFLVRLGMCPFNEQTPFVPYFGKNRVHRNKFEWFIYKTDHFDIYYYPELEKHLERVAGYAESAYQRISGELKHDLSDRTPLILFKTQSEFQQQNISGSELPEGVLAFAEPERNRMVLPIDEPPDQLYRLITHELTHVFEFSIIPRGIIGANLPLWMDEGLANYMAGYWNILDLMQVRDAAITDNVPKMSQFETAPLSGRLTYSMGHATFEFIESKWGKEGLRQFLFSLRKSVIGGGESAYEEALKLKPEDFDEQFDRYIKERFKPFRDKERPADYGRNIAPNRERTEYVSVLSLEPSPTGDMIAAVVGNRRDQELDIIMISSRDGRFIGNLTKGFDKDRGFEYISTAGGLRGNLVPWITWNGDRIAYLARTDKEKTLVIHNVVTERIEKKIDLSMLNGPESPAFSPDGRKIVLAALQEAVADLFIVDLETGGVTNLTKDAFAEYSPTYAPDGASIVYTARISGNDKLFRYDLTSGQRTQLTFGTHDDTAAKFYDDHTLVFTSTAIDPKSPLTPEAIKNANIPNVWSLDLRNGELRQWTDTVTGNVSPVVLKSGNILRVAFVSYYKGENGIHALSTEKPIATVDSKDFGEPAPMIDFTAPLSHTLMRDNIHKKGAFEKMSLAGRPPVGLGVTSSGNFYGNTQISFTDVLGDKQINFYAQSISQYRTTALTYVNVGSRFSYALQGFFQDIFYYGQSQYLVPPEYVGYLDRDLAEAIQSQRGGTIFGIYPFNRYSRAEVYGGYMHMSEHYTNEGFQALVDQYQVNQYGQPIFRNGHMMPLGVSFVKETTIFREYGPVAGSTLKVSMDGSPAFSDSWLSRRTLDVDLRHYNRLVANGVFAVRFKGFKSWGRNPDFTYIGGNSELRGYEYLEFIGQHAFFTNAELRFPLIEAMLTPLGVLGGLRGVFFFNLGAAGFNGEPYTIMTNKDEIYRPIAGYDLVNPITQELVTRYDPPVLLSGLRLVNARASYGIGLESFLLGFPMHFDWSWKTLFSHEWEDAYYRSCQQVSATSIDCRADGGSFRKVKFSFWIGYDF